MIYIAPVS